MLRHQLAPHICRGWPDGPGHTLRSRFGEVIAEEGASTVSNCSFVLAIREPPQLGLLFRPAGNLQRRQHRFPCAGYECARVRQVPASRCSIEQNRAWTMSTLFISDCLLQPPDWPGFRMFPPLASSLPACVIFQRSRLDFLGDRGVAPLRVPAGWSPNAGNGGSPDFPSSGPVTRQTA